MIKSHFTRIAIAQTKQEGFTLIELIIAATLSVILMLIATYGLSVIVQANQKGEVKSLTRKNLNRAVEFISDDIKAARTVSNSATWAWTNLGGGSPSPKLYLEIPLNIEAIDTTSDKIKITNHQFNSNDAITLSGSAANITQLSPSLLPNTVYCVIKNDKDNFQLAQSPSPLTDACNGTLTPIDLANNSIGDIGISRLIVYYLRDSAGTVWLKRKTINRSTRGCSTGVCEVLVDSIAIKDKDVNTKDGFNIDFYGSRKVRVNITGQLSDDITPLPDDTEKISAEVFARSAP